MCVHCTVHPAGILGDAEGIQKVWLEAMIEVQQGRDRGESP